MAKKVVYIRSRVTEKVPGLTRGKKYKFLKWGFWEGSYFSILNDHKEVVSIYDPEKYLYTEDVEDQKKARAK